MQTALFLATVIYMVLGIIESIQAMRSKKFRDEMRWRLRALHSIALVIMYILLLTLGGK